MDCRNCKHWAGTRHSTWGDCGQWIFTVDAMNHTDRFGNRCMPPLDPHDLQYYTSNSNIHGVMNFIEYLILDGFGVRLRKVERDVLWMDDHGVQTKQRKKIPFVQTRKDMTCERHEAR